MKKILQHTHSQEHHAAVKMFDELAAGFTALGREVVVCDHAGMDSTAVKHIRDLLNNDDIDFAISINCIGLGLLINDESYTNKFNIPFISILQDAPYSRFVKCLDVPCNNHIVNCLDKDHVECLKWQSPVKEFTDAFFMPLAGISKLTFDEVMSSKRDIDVVYSAGFWGIPTRSWHENNLNRSILKILDEITDYLENTPVTVVTACRIILQAHGFYDDEYMAKLYPYFPELLFYIKFYRRYKAMELLAKNDIKVDVYCDGWEQVPFADKLRIHGSVGYEETLAVFSRAKIVYQDQAEFNNGAHDRVFTAMLNGAVVVSEYSSYLAEEFTAGQELYMYDWQNGVQQVQVINELLADEPRRLAMALKAYSKAAKKHRWQNRAERLLEIAALCRAEREKR